MDEGTANLDLATERRISDTLKKLKITRVGVAHREEMIKAAGRIISLSDGIVSERSGAGG